MSVYGPNPPVGPIGYQPVEFLDIPPMSECLAAAPAPKRAEWSRPGLDERVRANLIRSARLYIAGLVAGYGGSIRDVESIIHELTADKAPGGPPVPESRPVTSRKGVS